VVSTDRGHRLVVAWESGGQDGDVSGVFAQRWLAPAILDIDGDGSTDALTDGLLVLRYHFGFTGATLITGVVSGGCTRCTAPAILQYLQSID
jgi:hypothetical protein